MKILNFPAIFKHNISMKFGVLMTTAYQHALFKKFLLKKVSLNQHKSIPFRWNQSLSISKFLMRDSTILKANLTMRSLPKKAENSQAKTKFMQKTTDKRKNKEWRA